MADSIKTQAMKAIETALKASVPEAKTVWRFPMAGLDLDSVETPAIFFYDDTEDRAKRNRLMTGKIRVIIGCYIPLTTSDTVVASDLADTIQARIHTAMMIHAATGNPLINMVEEETFAKDYPNAEFILLVGVYQVYYQHNYGDGFSQTGY
jgi:hypothetical protein